MISEDFRAPKVKDIIIKDIIIKYIIIKDIISAGFAYGLLPRSPETRGDPRLLGDLSRLEPLTNLKNGRYKNRGHLFIFRFNEGPLD